MTVAQDGREALACLEREPFDLVLMDLQRPVMDGFDATVEIRRRERTTGQHVRIVAMTAHAMNTDRERCLAAGMNGYVAEPIDPAALFSAVEADGKETPARGDYATLSRRPRKMTMSLSIGSAGPQVRELQQFLNRLPTSLPPLRDDGQFGPLTRNRVQDFQRTNRLRDDGIVGSLTLAAITEAIRLLGLLPIPPVPVNQAVRPINQQILGLAGTDNLVQQIIPPIMLVAPATFQRGVQSNRPSFISSSPTTGRLGIFAAKKGASERAVILLLPATGTPARVNICITQKFAQARKDLDPLGWSNPLSPPFIQFVLLKHVINRWGAQTLASKKDMAFVYITRAQAASELGPFANDGPFVKQVLTELVALTNHAFSFDHVEAFTFSSGISEFNIFSSAIAGPLSLEAVYNIDPNPAITAASPRGVVPKQFLSGQTFQGVVPPGFEFMPESRWANEPLFPRRNAFPAPALFNYLHNHCMPLYALHLGIQLS